MIATLFLKVNASLAGALDGAVRMVVSPLNVQLSQPYGLRFSCQAAWPSSYHRVSQARRREGEAEPCTLAVPNGTEKTGT